MIRVKLEIEEESREEAFTVYLAAFQKVDENVSSSGKRVGIVCKVEGKKLLFNVEAKDPVAMRAVLNTLLRNYKLICSLKNV